MATRKAVLSAATPADVVYIIDKHKSATSKKVLVSSLDMDVTDFLKTVMYSKANLRENKWSTPDWTAATLLDRAGRRSVDTSKPLAAFAAGDPPVVTFTLKPPSHAPTDDACVSGAAALRDAANREFEPMYMSPSTLGARWAAGLLLDGDTFFDLGFPDHYDDAHLPPEILLAEFSQFATDCEVCVPTTEEYNIITQFVEVLSHLQFPSEHARTTELCVLFNALLEDGLRFHVGKSDAATYGVVQSIITRQDHRFNAHIAIWENNLGFGSTASDPIVQSLGYYQQAITSVPKTQRADLLPCLNIVSVGPFFMVGAMYAAYNEVTKKSRSVWYPLTPMYPCTMYYLRPQYMNLLARTVIATRNCIQNLQKYYRRSKLRAHWGMPQDVTVEVLPGNKTAGFVQGVFSVTFLKRLHPGRLLFEGMLQDKPVVIKLATATYGTGAHKAAAAAGLAPLLYAHGKRGSHSVIVMENLSGYRHFGSVPTHNVVIAAAVSAAYTKLKELGIVHGDLHSANILVDDSDAEHPKVKFVDFDWAGFVAENKQYPGFINTDLLWHKGVKGGATLSQEHDVFLIEHWTKADSAQQIRSKEKNTQSFNAAKVKAANAQTEAINVTATSTDEPSVKAATGAAGSITEGGVNSAAIIKPFTSRTLKPPAMQVLNPQLREATEPHVKSDVDEIPCAITSPVSGKRKRLSTQVAVAVSSVKGQEKGQSQCKRRRD